MGGPAGWGRGRTCSTLGRYFTAQGLTKWYGTLQQPALAPPNWVFGPVWTTLFALTGTALWLVWREAGRAPQAVRLAIIIVLWVLILATIWAFSRVDRRAGLLLVPSLL